MSKLHEINIPPLKLGRIITLDEVDFFNCFLGFNNENDFNTNLLKIENLMKGFFKFEILWHFQNNTVSKSKSWYAIDNVMVYENTKTTDENRIVENGQSEKEFVFWMRVKI